MLKFTLNQTNHLNKIENIIIDELKRVNLKSD